MRQAVLVAPRRFEVGQAAMPPVGPGDVLVRTRVCGVCASELHAWEDGEDAPLLLGHEVAGEVVALGEGAEGFSVGDRVTGLFAQGFSDHAVAPADRVAAVPDGMPFEQAFGEPLACAMSGAERTRVALGDRVAIVGLGFMGLLMLQLVRLKGAAEILGIDLRRDALLSGRRLGADRVLMPEEIERSEKRTFPLDRDGKGRGFDVVVEATGTQEGLTLAGDLVREHGFLSILGYHQAGPRQVAMQLWNYKAIDVLNAHERRPEVRMAGMRRGLALAAAGRLDLSSLATHTFGLDQVGAGFEALARKPPGFVKSVIVL